MTEKDRSGLFAHVHRMAQIIGMGYLRRNSVFTFMCRGLRGVSFVSGFRRGYDQARMDMGLETIDQFYPQSAKERERKYGSKPGVWRISKDETYI